jgi:hypothetical protein
MSEPKLCPMRTEGADLFFPCIQEKCAWWVGKKTIYVSATHLTPACELNMDGHCVALDW